MAQAARHERQVAERIRVLGHTVEPFGQGLLRPDVRDYLTQTNSLLRWLPDLAVLIAAARVILLVDAKHCISSNTPNHSIEMRALLAARMTELPVWYVCDEFRALSLVDVVDDGGIVRPCCPDCWARFHRNPDSLPKLCPEHARRRGSGSGTPYVLVSKAMCRPLDRVFPPPPGSQRTAS
jgi:hypothetical protein